MIDKKLVEYFIDYLKRSGRTFATVEQEPYETLAIELQDWGFAAPQLKQLFVGYFYEQNGDQVPDPNIRITIGTEITAIVDTCMGTTGPDDEYVNGFLREVISRLSNMER